MKRLLFLNKYILNSIFFIFLCSSSLITKPNQTMYLDSMFDEEITVHESFKVFIDTVIKKALLQEEEHLLSHGLLNCYEKYSLNENCTTMLLSDLIVALPELLKELDNQLKAPRPETSHLNNAIAGPTTCDLGPIIALIHQLQAKINQCCQQQLECCAELIADFQQTWTILANLSTITASVDLSPIFTTINAGFNGTFSALEACCNNINQEFQETWTILNAGFNGTFSAIAAINVDSSGTFSVLQDIKNTITACCENITSEFQQTWTILATLSTPTASVDLSPIFTTINAGFNGTFSTLQDIKNTITACCENITSEFQQTWTILANLSTPTVSVDLSPVFTVINAGFNGTFSALETCCNNITQEFQGTWTILNAGFNGTFSAIAAINVDSSGTFSALQDIKNTITACCENITSEFQQTWTILANLSTPTASVDLSPVFTVINAGFNGTFSTLQDIKNTITACCANINSEFQQTWTILAAGFNGTFSSLTANTFTYSVITDLKATLSTDFNQTWTILKAGFNGTFSALQDIKNTLTNCCNNFNNTFSVLADLKATISTDFNQTWTILVAGFNGTFSAIADINNDTNGTFSALQDIKNTITACCANINSEFQQTWTILAAGFNGTFTAIEEINTDAAGTFSVLADIKATLSTDFNQTWTILTAGFNDTFSVLQDIRNAITGCCDNINSQFQQTWTILADIKATLSTDFNQTWTILETLNTFSVLADIKATLSTDFNQTWTILETLNTFSVLADLKATLSTDFNQTWTILTAGFNDTFSVLQDIRNAITGCCDNINSQFQQTWTILADIKATLSTDFNQTWTILETLNTFSILADLKATLSTDFNQTWTILTAGFNDTFSALQDIRNTITACCANITSEFQQTWTILAAGFNGTFTAIEEINTDAAGTFSVLADLKATLSTDFNQTWTILAAGFNGTFSSITANNFTYSVITDLKATLSTDFNQTWTILNAGFNGTFSALQDIKNTLTNCCSNFNGTFSVLADLKATLSTDFNQTWTILRAGFNGTFSSITANNFTYSVITDLKATLSTDFNQTWTILSAGFNGTFSAIASALSFSYSVITDLKATLSTDMYQTWTILTAGFNGTFSVLNVVTQNLCNPIMITQANFAPGGTTPLVISTPGVYKLGENITYNGAAATRAITIATSGVTLDLQCFSLTQGNANANVDGIRVNTGLTDVDIRNGMVQNFTRAGITVQNGCRRITVSYLTVFSCAVRGIEFLGSAGDLLDTSISHCTIDSCCQGATGDFALLLQQCLRCKVEQCDIINNGTTAHTLSGIRSNTCAETNFNNLNIISNAATVFMGIELLTPTRHSLNNIIIRGNTSTLDFTGISISGSNNAFNMFNNCQVLRNTGGSTLTGISLAANSINNMFMNCSIDWNTCPGAGNINGISLSGGAPSNSQNSFIDSIISGNSATSGANPFNGFLINGSDSGMIVRCIVSYNTSTNNQSTGINFASASGGNNWEVKDTQLIRNIGVNANMSFGILRTTGSNNLFTRNIAYGNGTTPANQFSGVTSVTTPAAPATNNLAAAQGPWTNLAVGS